jgi:DNA topoisomerase I
MLRIPRCADTGLMPRSRSQPSGAVGLRYVTDDVPGIRRQKRGGGVTYLSPEGEVISDPAMLHRFRSLVIPPAWTSVWICPLAEGHLQVTARDARGRKVYRYHPSFRRTRDESKFERMFELKDVLWKIRARVEDDIALEGLPRAKVMATVVWLLERTLIRVGSEQLARLNRSYGLTTLRHRHVAIEGTQIRFEFRGKSGVAHTVAVSDRRIARIIQRCQELPGQELFQYLDDEGRRQVVDAGDVNEYLREVTGRDITAKDFRTWAGTMLAAEALREMGVAPSKRQAEKNVVAAIDAASAKLGNTRTVCRKFYVHPALIDAYLDGSVLPPLPPRVWRKRSARNARLRRHEREVLAFLKERLEAGRQAPKQESMDPVLVSG